MLTLASLTACAGAATSDASGGAAEISESEWASVHRPRPAPLSGSARVTVSRIELLGQGRWSAETGVDAAVGLRELISVGLLRRRDVHFVERRRFAAAADRERRGEPRPEGAPPVGTSPGAELVLAGSWFPVGADSAVLELRLTDAESGRVARAWRIGTPPAATLPSLARAATGGLLRTLDEMGRRAAWNAPLAGGAAEPAPDGYRSAGVPAEAVSAFRAGVAAEDRYDWSAAYRAYRRAMEVGGEDFFEPWVALARAARLRAGGALGESP